MAELNPAPQHVGHATQPEGWIIGDAFEIRRPKTFWNLSSFRSVGKGRIVSGPTGANLELTLTLHPVVRAFISVWLWVAAAIFVGFGIAYLRDTTFGREAAPIGLAMLPFGYLMCLMLFRVDAALAHQLMTLGVVVAVRWYLRFNLSYRDAEELLCAVPTIEQLPAMVDGGPVKGRGGAGTRRRVRRARDPAVQ
jgi:hypothetical protein